MAKSKSSVALATDYLGGKASGWTPFHPAVADALRRHIPRKQDHPKAVTAALFLAVCYKWRGRSTRFGNGWFDKTHRQLCEELSCSDNWLDWVIDFLCMPAGDECPRQGLGLVYRLTDGYSNTSKYMLNDGRFTSFWLTSGMQPALTASSDVGLTASSDVGLTASSDVGLHHKDLQKLTTNIYESEFASEPERLNFDRWIASDSGKAIELRLTEEGVHDRFGMRSKVLVKIWSGGGRVVDFISQVSRLRNDFDASGGALTDWQGWLVSGLLKGF